MKSEESTHHCRQVLCLQSYFLDESTSPVASPLVILSKANASFIRFCEDYVEINKFIELSLYFIPLVQGRYPSSVYLLDFDMANAFHQVCLAQKLLEGLVVKGIGRKLIE
ncbi:hypothetical protein EON65_08600 [archaeon]|nr:MAG: hypothetical protein EON65_08600 [archaeon]